MALTDEQKQKIKEEEEIKAEEENYRADVKKELVKAPPVNRKKLYIWLFIILGGPLVLGTLIGMSSSTSPAKENLSGNVTYNDSEFKVKNLEETDWESCHFRLNNDYNYPGTSLADTAEPITAGNDVSIPASAFAKGDGTRFDPFSVKPQSLSADCNGRFGEWGWK